MKSLNFLLTLFIFGCSSPPQIGNLHSDIAPQLVVNDKKEKSGKVLYTWDRPNAFGQVSGRRKVLGDAACLSVRADLEAIGYHPTAKGVDGKPISGGGYFCAVKAEGDRPSPVAPMLVRTDGELGWDQPRAFGAIPDALRQRGDALCRNAHAGYVAVGYHPRARNEIGKEILGGGFYCAPKFNNAKALA